MSNNLSLTNPDETIIMEAHIEDPESNIIPPLYMLIPPLPPPILEHVHEILPLSSVNEDFANPFESDSDNEYSNATNYNALQLTLYNTIQSRLLQTMRV